jgi:DedD protein
VSNEAIAGEKKALPVVSTNVTAQTPALPEKIASAPSVQSERQGIDPKSQSLQEPAARTPRVELAQKPALEPVVSEQKQIERFGATKTATSAKPIQPSPSPENKSAAPSISAVEPPTEKPPPEQLALLKKPADVIVETKPAVRAAKPLEGFVIQIAFNDKDRAQRWAETMERRGYAVSITEVGTEGALRVRLGNFAVRDEAERQLRTFKQEGMNGIIINLPQGFRPAHASVP